MDILGSVFFVDVGLQVLIVDNWKCLRVLLFVVLLGSFLLFFLTEVTATGFRLVIVKHPLDCINCHTKCIS